MMNAKLLTDKALQEDLYTEMMYIAGSLAYYQEFPEKLDGDAIRHMIDKQIEFLMPVIKRHIKRHVRVANPKSVDGVTNENI